MLWLNTFIVITILLYYKKIKIIIYLYCLFNKNYFLPVTLRTAMLFQVYVHCTQSGYVALVSKNGDTPVMIPNGFVNYAVGGYVRCCSSENINLWCEQCLSVTFADDGDTLTITLNGFNCEVTEKKFSKADEWNGEFFPVAAVDQPDSKMPSPQVHECKFGENCKNSSCTFSHPRGRVAACPMNTECYDSKCTGAHCGGKNPACNFGNRCNSLYPGSKHKCLHKHPPGCPHGDKCGNPRSCVSYHAPTCRHGVNCNSLQRGSTVRCDWSHFR
jgi:hypothetical protein